MQQKEVGGGPATGLANDFVSFLQNGLQTGSFGSGSAGQRFMGANPVGSTMDIGSLLDQLISGNAGVSGGMNEMISKQGDRDAAALRARYGASGGMGFGTPAAYGEALLRSETAPKLAQVGQQGQLEALGMLLPMFMNLAGRGISQRETVMEPNNWISMLQALAPIAGTVGGALIGGPAGAAIGGSIGSGIGNMGGKPSVVNTPNISMTPIGRNPTMINQQNQQWANPMIWTPPSWNRVN